MTFPTEGMGEREKRKRGGRGREGGGKSEGKGPGSPRLLQPCDLGQVASLPWISVLSPHCTPREPCKVGPHHGLGEEEGCLVWPPKVWPGSQS